MQKQDYAGLSRTFDMYYPDVKRLVKETEQFYNSNDTDSERWHLTDYDNVRLIGTLTLYKSDYDVTLPRLYFKKEAEMTNPAFYVITRPSLQVLQDATKRIIHIGTSVEAASPYAYSVSALTGGILPHTEKSRAFSTYLKIMSCIKGYGYCTVYELQTGYDDICIKGINGATFAKETFAKQIFNFINCDSTGKKFNDDFLLGPEERAQKEAQNARDNKIWDAVTSFKTMVNTKPEVLDALAKLSEPVMKKYKDDQQEITVEQNGDKITFKLKKKVIFVSSEEERAKKDNELEKLIPTSAKILCQTGDTVYDKYTSYIVHKLNGGGKIDEETEKKFVKCQKRLAEFETFISDITDDITNGDKWIEYGNIYFGNLRHIISGYRIFNDGTAPRISIRLGTSPSLEKINIIADAIKDLFDLDPETKVVLTS